MLVDKGSGSRLRIWASFPLTPPPPRARPTARPRRSCSRRGAFRPRLKQMPLTFAQPLPTCVCASPIAAQDPRQALPEVTLTGTTQTSRGTVATGWTPQPDLLESGPDDTNFVVEMDDAGYAHLRFGNGDEGRLPDAGTAFSASYRVGNGPDGNVGAETICYLVFRGITETGATLLPRNPMPAAGGMAREAADDVRMFAPYAFRDVLERAVTADDYATLAQDNARRLAARSSLASAAAPQPVPPPSGTDRRGEEEEEPGAPAGLPPDICLIPFEPLQNAKARFAGTEVGTRHGSQSIRRVPRRPMPSCLPRSTRTSSRIVASVTIFRSSRPATWRSILACRCASCPGTCADRWRRSCAVCLEQACCRTDLSRCSIRIASPSARRLSEPDHRRGADRSWRDGSAGHAARAPDTGQSATGGHARQGADHGRADPGAGPDRAARPESECTRGRTAHTAAARRTMSGGTGTTASADAAPASRSRFRSRWPIRPDCPP